MIKNRQMAYPSTLSEIISQEPLRANQPYSCCPLIPRGRGKDTDVCPSVTFVNLILLIQSNKESVIGISKVMDFSLELISDKDLKRYRVGNPPKLANGLYFGPQTVGRFFGEQYISLGPPVSSQSIAVKNSGKDPLG